MVSEVLLRSADHEVDASSTCPLSQAAVVVTSAREADRLGSSVASQGDSAHLVEEPRSAFLSGRRSRWPPTGVPYERKHHMSSTQPTDVGHIMRFFGKKPGQTTLEFKAELDALTPDDKVELGTLIRELNEEAPLAA